jgi:hypothetical protein
MVVAMSLSLHKSEFSIGGDGDGGGHEPEFAQIRIQHWW